MSNLAQCQALARINALVDENSFVEIGSMITARATDYNMQSKDTPADGVVTGYGVIDGNLVYVYSQDASVLGGTVGEMHAKKISKVYDLAVKVGAPVIALVDCAGLRLQEAMDSLNAFGEIYMNQVKASGVVPQITAVFGTCGGGMGLSASMSDFTFVAENGKLFVNAPNTLDGNVDTKCNTAGAAYQAKMGVADFTGNESEVLSGIRQLTTLLAVSCDECTDDLNRVCAELGACAEDTSIALSHISDNNLVLEVKKDYAKEMVTAFIKLNGMTVGVVANRTVVYGEDMKAEEKFEPVLTTAGCKKAARFVKICDAFDIPVVTFTNATGFKATVEEEATVGMAAAELTYAFANATVPKVNVVVGKAFGSAYNIMNSKAIGADIVYAWPQAQIGTMDAENAVRIIYADEIAKADDKMALINEKKVQYAKMQESAVAAAKRGYVDSILEPEDTRKYLIGALEMLFTKEEERPYKKHGTI